jgi:hypothetical protein
MKTFALALCVLALPGPALAICMDSPLAADITKADTVFVATVTDARLEKPLSQLKGGDYYSVLYGFSVVKRIKGDPTVVSALATRAVFSDPSSETQWHFGEQTNLIPGESVLVVASDPGVIQVSAIGCTPSRPWNEKTIQATSAIPGFAP